MPGMFGGDNSDPEYGRIYPEDEKEKRRARMLKENAANEQARLAAETPLPEPTVTVNREALRQVLNALLGPDHHIRELQATLSLHGQGMVPNHPIGILLNQYREATK